MKKIILICIVLPVFLFGQKIKYSDFSPQLKSDLKDTTGAQIADSIADLNLSASSADADSIRNVNVDTTGIFNNAILKYSSVNDAWEIASDATGAGGSAYSDSVVHDGRHVPGDSLITDAEGAVRYVPFSSSSNLTVSTTTGNDMTFNSGSQLIYLRANGLSTYGLSVTPSTSPASSSQILALGGSDLNVGSGTGGDISVQGVNFSTILSGNYTVAPAGNIVLNPIGTTSITNLVGTSVESEIEAVVDLQNLQGAVIDGQVPNSITIDEANDVDTTGTKITAALGYRLDNSDIGVNVQAYDADLDDLADGSLTASKVAGVADADYGDVSVASGSWTLDNDVVSTAEMADADHGDFSYLSGVASIDANAITEEKLSVTNSPTDNYVLSYNAAGTNFTWVQDQTGAGGSSYADSANTGSGRFDFDDFFDASGDIDTTNLTSAQWNTYISNHDDDTQLTEEEVEDFVGGMLGGTETGISVTYQDASGDIDFVVSAGDAQVDNGITLTNLSQVQDAEEAVEDYVGGMVTGNTETGITVTYQDADGTVDYVVSVTEPQLDVTNSPTDNYILSYNAAGTNFTWVQDQTSADSSFVVVTGDTVKVNYLAGKTGNTIALIDTLTGIGAFDTVNTTVFQLADVAVTATAAELNYSDGVTSNIQTQLDGKEGTLTNEAGLYSALSDVSLFLEDLVDDTSPQLGGNLDIQSYSIEGVDATEFGYVDGVTSDIQTQLNAKGPLDTLTYNWGVMDTVVTGTLPGWKVPYDITIIEIAAYTDANTTTFNLEERAEATPNTAGTDAMAADLVADNDQQEQTSFSNAGFAKDTWAVPTISATGDVSIFSMTVRYIKQ